MSVATYGYGNGGIATYGYGSSIATTAYIPIGDLSSNMQKSIDLIASSSKDFDLTTDMIKDLDLIMSSYVDPDLEFQVSKNVDLIMGTQKPIILVVTITKTPKLEADIMVV